MTPFQLIRENCLIHWAQETGRKIKDDDGNMLLTDSFAGAYECEWQNKFPGGHVNLFCSLEEWACNFTDMLKDDRLNYLDLDQEDDRLVVFRYFTRVMLIVSELLKDFQDIYLHANGLKSRKEQIDMTRNFYFPAETPSRITKIFNYINHTCKHKTQHIHICNDHLPIYFQDSFRPRKRYQYITIQDSTVLGKNAILVPKLQYLVRSMVICYRRINVFFKQYPANFRQLCANFSAP